MRHTGWIVHRYKHFNDQSIVLMVNVAGTTSDREWLKENAGRLAVISVGANDYSHPALWVETVLAEASAWVVRTDQHGDVVVKPVQPGG